MRRRVEGAFSTLGYDTARHLMAGPRQAASAEPEKAFKALADIGTLKGVTGVLSYPPGSRIPSKSAAILGIEAARRKRVRLLAPTEAPSP